MQPGTPYLHHFTVGGSDDARGVLERLNRHMQAECRSGQRMRLHVALGGKEETTIGLEERPATSIQGGLSTSANYLLILTPKVWESRQVQQQVLQAEQLGKTIMLLYRPNEQVHLPRYPTSFSPDPALMAMAGVDLASLICTAPKGVAELFDFMEAIPYRSYPFLERAVARHIISLSGCGASLTTQPPPDPSVLVAEYMEDAPVTTMYKELFAGNPVYYEGVALKQSKQDPTHMLRGYYQALLCLSKDQHSEGGTSEKQVSLDLSYSPKLNESMPQCSTTVKLSWQPINGSLVQKSPPIGGGSHWAPWTGCIEEKSASIRAREGNDVVILR
ncbi:hypothetical protein DUNSADRAFT_5955 [Dunaliella salina]|uniref:Uncharacterized protein n=1 Tax=Dunaliella salina TaxID=3046 RepID=A0ABQ7FU23_DUNSA|nr:hypothetical protein DUNSADRAFT_5955 [Dunaliella salina]|eukprot:KAF5825917.1 hypothetical protein DUNSADRAFT_5955 [Dunaliella salina]